MQRGPRIFRSIVYLHILAIDVVGLSSPHDIVSSVIGNCKHASPITQRCNSVILTAETACADIRYDESLYDGSRLTLAAASYVLAYVGISHRIYSSVCTYY